MSGGINTAGTPRSVQATVYQIDSLHIYEVTKEELISMLGTSFSKSLFSVLTGISISACISFIITILTTTISNPKTYAVFVAVIIVFGFASLICGFFWIKAEIISYKTGNKYLKKSE